LDKVNNYFEASVRQHIQRGEHLISSIPKPVDLPQEMHRLVETTNQEINRIMESFRFVLDNPLMQKVEYQSERLRSYRRAVQALNILENTCVATLTRHHTDDAFLTRLVGKITQEIAYPILPPVVTSLSQQYFHIYPNFKLLFVPLVESSFLLHLPDLYHELAHPLITEKYNSRTKPFQKSLLASLICAYDYISDEKQREKRSRGPKGVGKYLELWEKSWHDWAVEFFCDLFAVYTLGPAYAWSHIHLCFKNNDNPFRFPIYSISSHPADHARMEVMLHGLKLIGFDNESMEIEQRWKQLIAISGTAAEPEFLRCYPPDLIELFAQKAYEGVYETGLRIVSSHESKHVENILNMSWKEFWQSPKKYTSWEQRAIIELKEIAK
jgi:hypothetical protein